VVLRHEQENAGRGGIFKIVYACWWVKNTEMSKFIDAEQDVDQL
jgi:hypothetical protein